MTAVATATAIATKPLPAVRAHALAEVGVMELLQDPKDDVNACRWITWEPAKLAVKSTVDLEKSDGTAVYEHNILIENADRMGNPATFGVEECPDGTFKVGTVGGWEDTDRRAQLNATQSAVLAELIHESLTQ